MSDTTLERPATITKWSLASSSIDAAVQIERARCGSEARHEVVRNLGGALRTVATPASLEGKGYVWPGYLELLLNMAKSAGYSANTVPEIQAAACQIAARFENFPPETDMEGEARKLTGICLALHRDLHADIRRERRRWL